MAHKLSYSSIVRTNGRATTMFGGSSKHLVIDGEILDKSQLSKLYWRRKKKSINLLKEENTNEADCVEKKEQKKSYKLNKSKVKKKCHALSRLDKSKKFLAFYSISFPVGLPDENAYKIFNTWLTRCRRDLGLKTYLWVAARQKNGTIHFHLLTNDFMPIKQVNDYMSKSLISEKKKGIELLKDIDLEKYNGVDVKKVGQNKNGLISYLAKYVTKNEIEFHRLPWHCSRDVSRLFTSINYNDEEQEFYRDRLPVGEEYYSVKQEEYYKVFGFKFKPKAEIYNELDIVNEVIYNK